MIIKTLMLIVYIVNVECEMIAGENDFNECSGVFNDFWKSALPFIKDRHANVIITKDTSTNFGTELLSCGMRYFGIQCVHHILGPTSRISQRDRNLIFKSRSSAFYLIISDRPENSKNRLKSLSSLNPTIRIVLVFTNSSQKEITDYLESLWKLYKVLNVVVYRLDGKFVNETGNKFVNKYVNNSGNKFVDISENKFVDDSGNKFVNDSGNKLEKIDNKFVNKFNNKSGNKFVDDSVNKFVNISKDKFVNKLVENKFVNNSGNKFVDVSQNKFVNKFNNKFENKVEDISEDNFVNKSVENKSLGNKLVNLSENKLRNGLKFKISMHDPFVIKKYDQKYHKRGHVYTISADNSNQVNKFWGIFKNRLKNVHGYPLRICIFEYAGTSSAVKDKNGTTLRYSLKDGFTIDALVKTLNFSPIYFSPRDGVTYGFVMANGTQFGAIKEIDQGNADILGNLRPVKEYGQKNSIFLFPVDEMRFAFLAPKMSSSSIVSFLRIYDMSSSISLAIVFFTMASVWNWLQKFGLRENRKVKNYNLKLKHEKFSKKVEVKIKRRKNLSFVEISVLLFGAMLQVSQSDRRERFERCLFMSMVMFSMVICYTYEGKMVERLSASKISLDINTLDALAKSDLNIITVSGFKDLLKDIAYADLENEVYMKLYKKQQINDGVAENVRRVYEKRDSALLWSYLSCNLYKLKFYSNTTGRSLMHIVQEGPPQRYNSNLVPKNSPFVDRFNQILMKIRESGLVPKWRQDFYHSLRVQTLRRPRETGSGRIYTMRELSFVFRSWAISAGISIVVFIGEYAIYRWFKR